MDSNPEPFDRLAEAVADGEPIDWQSMPPGSGLCEDEMQALKLLQDLRCTPGSPALSTGLEIGAPLGHGSHGVVLTATDRALGRQVALKVLGEDAPLHAEVRARYIGEARLLASLDHPNIVRIYGIDEVDGRIRIALEKVAGRTLAQVVDEHGPLAPVEAAHVALDLCKALAAIHGKGIVHRDLKATNVMRAEGGRIVLLDFGIATIDGASPALFTGGAGTPLLMAPEQFAQSGCVDQRTDLYALGVLLYWLVSAHYPFAAPSFAAVRQRVVEGRATPLTDVRQDVPLAFAALVNRALSRRPEDRFQSAGEFEDALRQFLGGAAAPALTPRRRRRWAVVAAAAALLIVVVGWLWSTRPADDYVFTAQLCKETDGELLPLPDDGVIRPGDALALRTHSSVPLHVYVINEDASNVVHAIFPLPGGDLRNPIPAGAHDLPGAVDGVPQNWTVSNLGGGAEHFLVVASPAPIREIEELASSLPSLRLRDPVESRDLVLRGIEMTQPRQGRGAKQGVDSPPARLEQLFAQLGGAPRVRRHDKTLILLSARTEPKRN